MTYAIPRFNGVTAKRNARNARDGFAWIAQRARARAIQTGQTQLFQFNPLTERAWVVRRGGSTAADTLVTVNFQTEWASTMATSSNNPVTLCFGPRGYAYNCHANSPTNNVDVTFTHATYTSQARVKVLGTVERL